MINVIIYLNENHDANTLVKDLLADREQVDEMCRQAKKALATHENAVQKTIKLLNMNASVRGGIMQE